MAFKVQLRKIDVTANESRSIILSQFKHSHHFSVAVTYQMAFRSERVLDGYMRNLFTSECIPCYRVSSILCHPHCIIRSLPQFSELVYYIFHGSLLPLHLALIHISFSAILVIAWKTVLYYFRPELFMTQFVGILFFSILDTLISNF